MVRAPSKQKENSVEPRIQAVSIFLITLNLENERKETTCDHC